MTRTEPNAVRWSRAFLLAVVVWTAGMAGGYAVVRAAGDLPSEIPVPASTEDASGADAHGRLAGDAASMSDAGLLAFIFRRNLTVYVWLLAGLLSAGAVTFVVLLVNGIMLGNTIGLAYDAGVAPETLIDLLLPHGMLEVGTFCIAGAVGFQGFRIVFDWERNGWSAVRSLRLGLVFAYGALALAVAAALETFVTGALAEAWTTTGTREPVTGLAG